jgi:Zn-dependent protease/CBS domain-containing protein
MAVPESSGDAPPAPARSPTRGIFGGTAWSIGRVRGIELAIDHSWLLIFLLITFSLGAQFRFAHPEWSGVASWGAALVTSPLFFGSILLHELGHSLMAQRLGVRVRSITLFVFGGMARLDSEAQRPRDEVLIAVSGPLVSVGLGFAFTAAAGPLQGAPGWGAVAGAVLGWLGRINLILAAFNVVPGFPLDGGRVLRGVVWGLTGSFTRATRIAAASGSLFAYFLMATGAIAALFGGQIVGGLWFVFIGWFLLTAARATVGQMLIERMLERVRAGDAMESVDDACVAGSESVAELVAETVLRTGLRTLYVVDPERHLRGLVTLRELAQTAPEERPHTRVDEVMVPAASLAVLAPAESGWTAFQRMADRNVNQLPVVAGGRLVGALTRERLLAMVQAGVALALEEGSPERFPAA